MYYNKDIDAGKIMESIRILLGLTIDEFCIDLGWSNSQHYYAIRDGAKNRDGIKVKTSPTLNKLYGSINNSINSLPAWSNKRDEIISIVIKETFKK